MSAPHITPAGLVIEAPLKLAKQIGKTVAGCRSLDSARRALAAEGSAFDDWFIYTGGNHIALHHRSGEQRRALITKRVPT